MAYDARLKICKALTATLALAFSCFGQHVSGAPVLEDRAFHELIFGSVIGDGQTEFMTFERRGPGPHTALLLDTSPDGASRPLFEAQTRRFFDWISGKTGLSIAFVADVDHRIDKADFLIFRAKRSDLVEIAAAVSTSADSMIIHDDIKADFDAGAEICSTFVLINEFGELFLSLSFMESSHSRVTRCLSRELLRTVGLRRVAGTEVVSIMNEDQQLTYPSHLDELAIRVLYSDALETGKRYRVAELVRIVKRILDQ